MQKALVTGANGFIGSALTLRLLRDGIQVRALCRNPRNGQALESAGAEIIGGDIQEPFTLTNHVKGCNMVFHVAAALNGGAAYQYNVNVQGTRNVIQAAHQAGASRFVQVSSIAVYGANVHGSIWEDYPQRPPKDDFYMQSKSLAEAAVWAYNKRFGFPVVSIRPGFVYGPGSGFWSRQLYQLCKTLPFVPLINGGTGHAHPIFIEDLVDLLVLVGTHPAAPGNAFNAAPDPAPTWREFIGYYAAMAGNTRFMDISADRIAPIGKLIRTLTQLRGEPVAVDKFARYMSSDATYRMTRAAELLNWRPQTSLKEGMGLTEPWLKSSVS